MAKTLLEKTAICNSSDREDTDGLLPRRCGRGFAWTVVHRSRRFVIGTLVLVVIGLVALGVGPVGIPLVTVAKVLASRLPLLELTRDWPASWDTILWDIRAPRVLLAGIVGASLAVAGATYQGVFRNPLADPYLIGVASGAGLGATIFLVSGVPNQVFGVSVLPAAAFAGAITTVTVVYLIARASEGLPLTTLILSGVAVSSLASAMTILLMMRSDTNILPVFSWLLGGFISAQWSQSLTVLIYVVPGGLVVMLYGRVLNVLQLEEEHAQQLGVNVERMKIVLLAAASLTTAAAVSFSGLIGFVGLIAPHAVRLIWGVDYRSLLPMAVLVGATFLILADLVARTVVSPAELPVGVVTAFCGAPFFLYLLRKRSKVLR